RARHRRDPDRSVGRTYGRARRGELAPARERGRASADINGAGAWIRHPQRRCGNAMTVVLYRSNLSLTSGAGQLIQTQAEGLTAAGETVRVLCRTGGLKFRLRTGLRVGRASARSFAALRRADANVIVDHGMEIPGADVVFVHNLFAEGLRHVDRDDWRERADRERCFFGDLRGAARIVANSRIVQRALVDRIGV